MSNTLFAKSSRGFWRPALLALCLVSVLTPAGFIAHAPQGAYAQTRSFHMDHYDTDITVNADGTLDIVETLSYVFDIGTFRRGTRFIPLDRVEGISNISVEEIGFGPYTEGSYNGDDAVFGTDHTFGTRQIDNKLYIRWVHTNTGTSRPKTFRLGYRVTGGMRVYPTFYQLDWNAIPPDWDGNIQSSRVTVHFPGSFDTSKLDIASKPEVESSREANGVTWTASNVNNGLEVGIKQIPKEILQTTKSSWQDAVDFKEKMQPFIDIGLTGSGLLILIFGPLWAVRKWYKYGRDLPVTLHSDYVADTPSDLPPGLVGTLLDELADVRDVIATIVDQGRKGNLTINELESQGILSSTKEFQYKQTGSKTDFRFEQMVLDAVFQNGPETSLSDMKNTFYKDLPPIYSEMYGELVRLNYFPEDPSAVRTRYIMGGIGFIVLGALVVGASYLIGGGITFFPMIPAVALGITGLVRMGIARSMPRKTDFGSQEAQKWRAFQRYLEEIQRYTDVQAAADKFQKYLPYAVALGVEKQLTAQFNSVPAAMPPYYIPYGWYPYGANPMGTSASGTSVGGGGVGNFDPGAAMQTMSNSFGSAMQGMSDSFTDMVNSASSILTSQPSSSGSGGSSGWGGGGGSFGGGGGGGGGGGAD